MTLNADQKRWALASTLVGGGALTLWLAWKYTRVWKYRNDPGQAAVFPVEGGTWPTRPVAKFGYDRTKMKGKIHSHQGVDIHADVGTPIYASMGGVVTHACAQRSGHCRGFDYYGRVVVIESPPNAGADRMWWMYAHLDDVYVKKGDTVEKGAQIGTLGDTCFSSADPYDRCSNPHLHFEVSPRKYPQGSEKWRYSPHEIFEALETSDPGVAISEVATTKDGPLIYA